MDALVAMMKDLEREELPPHMVRVPPAEIKRVGSRSFHSLYAENWDM